MGEGSHPSKRGISVGQPILLTAEARSLRHGSVLGCGNGKLIDVGILSRM